MIPYGHQNINQDDIDSVVNVLKSDYLTQGPQVPLFESSIATLTQARFAVASSSASAMLHVACLALGVSKGDRVWTSSITFVSSANCALHCGAEIDFVDVDISTANMCPKALELKLQLAEQGGTLPKVIIPVHMAGHSCNMEAIGRLARQYNIKVIEDAAHGIGGYYQGRAIGCCQYSDITVFSFHPVKIITTAEGGVATTNDAELAKRMRLFSSHGITKEIEQLVRPDEGDWYYEQQHLGLNYRMTDLHAALGNSQVHRIGDFIERRHQLVARYQQLFVAMNLKVVTPLSDSVSAYHLLIIQLPDCVDRKFVFNRMREMGVCVHVHYFPVHLQPYFMDLGFKAGDFPNAEHYYQHCLTLPLFPDLTFEQQDEIVTSLKGLV
ncbi:UDP-4-amino-4,6-dideoxy-N-acetyl-beta-L-altrosamine transaminase [Shewanella psychropiezotolerans]|uniref:UDP-4-amino-4, 6-dideoxy-N-acetyl-beta-L-altrosamine transaminase n=1 Tax=Shewanella psychropiezotolerans TaxID=2593655 RepID=A0ABX5X7A4_9GAMM|nr:MULTISPECIES: UDP-4-amino-4,6-dideoxy-N-acetyl-beta-L-altrosamine transaminase [Shewanella]MPY24953.1 UDP-4-amino-4,6-dideoxy-N-acetyl-beta-L-altrosamine transaminase [Shewanella sp. YLB-07]QDO86627.1 UDP-4-amino-4,6-dideoxy-N-acetyl-beta-L-altrosamine transaminase [Shewanella psychropiezotolerans]